MWRNRIFLGAVLLLPLVVSGVASAALTISQTQPFSGTPNMSPLLTFNQFDTVSGTLTLTGIEMRLILNTSNGQMILDNDGAGSASGTFEFGSKATISSTDVALVDVASQPVVGTVEAMHSDSFSLAGDPTPISGDYNPAPTDGMSYNGGAETDTHTGNIGPAVFGPYQGTGTYNITVDVVQWLNYGAIGGIEYAVSPVDADGTLRVIYTYTPEPATMAMLGLGALGLAARRRRGR
jgi:hypothetical protein